MKTIAALLICFGFAVCPAFTRDSVISKNGEAATLTQDDIAKAYAESYRQETVGKFDEAIRALSEVYKIYPKSYTVNYRMGWLFYCNRNYADAMIRLDCALVACPASVEALNVQNLVFVARSEWTAVESQSLKVIKIDYYNTYANRWYAVALRMQGKYNASILLCRKILEIFPSSALFLQELAVTLFHSGEKTESRSVFESVLILDPNNETAKAYLQKY
jgi:tetratricopeptide (TPR) repeat protein